jgi:hypothetical protein
MAPPRCIGATFQIRSLPVTTARLEFSPAPSIWTPQPADLNLHEYEIAGVMAGFGQPIVLRHLF